jgi:hypothetical protein
MKKRLPWIMTDFSRRISEVSPRMWILLGLAVLTFAIYGRTAWHPFIDLDDDLLVSGNPRVRSGLTWENLLWAFTSTSGASFWHPLTWLSHMLDVELFGMNAGGHHLVSVFLHAMNAMVLFLVLARMTGFPWRSAFVAALFAVHPLHVESVAWAAERKDVLSTLFFLLSLWAYARYAERPGRGRYGLIALFFALSLMSKPMGVTLPFALLLLDYWPLRRIEGITKTDEDSAGKCPHVTWKRTLLEKIPLLLMSAVSAALTLSHEGDTTWVMSLDALTIGFRISNSLVSYVTYLGKMAWPLNLSIFYPHPAFVHSDIPAWQVVVAALLLGAISFFVLWQGKRRPWLAVGWYWYLGTLIPVIGLVQVGAQAMADRFTYVPLIGIFIMVAWNIPETLGGRRIQRLALAVAGGSVLGVFSVLAWLQVGYWHSDPILFTHALSVTEKNWVAWDKLGILYLRDGQYVDAVARFQESLRIKPDDFYAWNNLGVANLNLGLNSKAIENFRTALSIRPEYAKAHYNLGNALERQGNPDEAIAHFQEALRLNPEYALARQSLEIAKTKKRIGR